jgi:phosphoribosylanthranilate isomerase
MNLPLPSLPASLRRTRIKICGIRKAEDALFAAHAGADAVGLIFYAASPRAVSLEEAIRIRDALPPLVSTVALFVNAAAADVAQVCKQLRPSLLQFHGDETPEYCRSIAYPHVKAIRVPSGAKAADLLKSELEFGVRWEAGSHGMATSSMGAKALLLDTFSPTQYGGSGESFDWSVIPEDMRSRVLLSGGLTPENVFAAITQVQPWAVDVSSGVEQLNARGEVQKGTKDHARIQAFIAAVREADHAMNAMQSTEQRR